MLTKAFAVLLLVGSATALLRCQSLHQSRPTLKTYTSPDGVFRFQYTDQLAVCRQDTKQTNMWDPPVPCNGWIPLCSDGGRNVSGVAACLGYKSGPQEKDTTFGGAVFTAVDLGKMKDQAACMQASPPLAASRKWRIQRINGTKFHVKDTDGGQGGHWAQGHVYRVLHEGTCYELDTLVTGTNGQISDPPTPEFNVVAVKKAVKAPLRTFEFLK